MYPYTGREKHKSKRLLNEDFKRKQNHIVYELKRQNDEGREGGREGMSLKNAQIIAWDD